MSFDMTVKVHSIADDGLPPEDMTNVAFIFDGCIVSGWPLGNGPEHDQGYSGLWEADSDVGHHRPFKGITHWVEFPVPLITIGKEAHTVGDSPWTSTRRVPVDLAAVRARFELARMAGTDADDAGNGWTPAKIRAVVASWQDVATLHDEVKRLRKRLIKVGKE